MPRESDQPQPQTFKAGLEFIEKNADADNWFLQIETFDPHEPFFSHRKYHDLYNEMPHDPDLHFDWPYYQEVTEGNDEVAHIRREYAALLSQCDAYLGDVLDAMDKHDLWNDTLLVVWTDHGFMLGEHNCWAKLWMPFYEEIAHTPFWVHDPRAPDAAGTRRQSLVQPAIDLAPTLLDFFGVESTPDMIGKSLAQTVAADAPVREAGIFGTFGAPVNVTDGRYVYMHGPKTEDNQPLFNYTQMPTVMRGFLPLNQLRSMEIAPPFSFTKGCPTMKIPARGGMMRDLKMVMETQLWDVQSDPQQTAPMSDSNVKAQMTAHLTRLLGECDAPSEQYERLGLVPAAREQTS
jgi:arylsulfatase A-like enzyme